MRSFAAGSLVALRLLIDEQLSPRLVERLAVREVYARHVAHLGLSGASDPQVWLYAFEHDFVVVTANAADFIRLADSADLHAGLIVIREAGLSRDGQWARLEYVIDHLSAEPRDLVNQVIEVWAIGELVIRPIPISPRR